MKHLIVLAVIVTGITFGNSQELYQWKDNFKSSKHPYSITIPQTFKKAQPNRPNIDLKFADDYGASILVNVTKRLPEEYNITAHDYSREMLENAYRQGSPNFTIHSSEKLFIDGQKAFLIEYTGGASSKLKAMECYIYYNDKVYVLTATALKSSFNNYRALFLSAIKSIDFS